MNLGCNRQHIVPFESHSGLLDGCRLYWGSGEGTSGFNHDQALAAEARGERCIISSNPSGSWANWASGTADAYTTNDANWCNANLRPGLYIVHHEPENDGGNAADYVAGATHLNTIARNTLDPGWQIWSCYIAFSFRNGVAPNYYVQNSDGWAIDGYNRFPDLGGGHVWWTAAQIDPGDNTPPIDAQASVIYGPAATAAAANGKLFGIFEMGMGVEDPAINPNSEVPRTGWYGETMTYLKSIGCQWGVQFDNDENDGNVNWRISPGGPVGNAGLVTIDAFMTGRTAVATTTKVLMVSDEDAA